MTTHVSSKDLGMLVMVAQGTFGDVPDVDQWPEPIRVLVREDNEGHMWRMKFLSGRALCADFLDYGLRMEFRARTVRFYQQRAVGGVPA